MNALFEVASELTVFFPRELELNYLRRPPRRSLLVQSNYVSTPIKSCDIFNQLWQMLYSETHAEIIPTHTLNPKSIL